MKYTTKDQQDAKLKAFVEHWVGLFNDDKPVKTIGNHHYVRVRHLEQFMYDFALTLLVQEPNYRDVLKTPVKDTH